MKRRSVEDFLRDKRAKEAATETSRDLQRGQEARNAKDAPASKPAKSAPASKPAKSHKRKRAR
jgi:hypothetical protein